MTNRNRVADVLLRYKVDERSVRTAENANKQQIRSINELTRESKALSRANVDNVLSANAKAATDAAKAYDRAADNANRLATAQDRFDATSRNVSLAGDVQSNLGALSGLSSAAGAGGLGQGIAVTGEVAALIEELPRLKEAAKGLPQTLGAAAQAAGPVGIGLGAAALALAVTLGVLQRATQAYRKELDADIAARKEISDLLANDPTTEELQAALADLQEQQASAARAANENAGALADVVAESNKFGLGFAVAGNLIGIGGQQLDAYGDAATAAGNEVERLQGQIELLEAALENGSTAAADAAARELELAQVRQQQFDAAVASQQQLLSQFNASDFGTDDLDRLIKARENDRDSILAVIDTLGLSEQEQERYRQNLEIINSDLALLNEVGAEAARVNQLRIDAEANRIDLEKQTAALVAQSNRDRLRLITETANREKAFVQFQRSATTGATADRLTALQDERDALQSLIAELEPIAGESDEFAIALANARDDLRQVNTDIERTFGTVAPAAIQRLAESIQNDIAEAGVNRQQAVNEAANARAKGLADAAQQLNQGLEELDRDFKRQQAENKQESIRDLEQFQRDERDRVRSHQSELVRIQRDAQDTIQDAALTLDAGSLRRARRDRDRQLDDAQERFDVETEQAEQRLELIKREAADERRELIQGYQDRRRDLLQANRQTVNDLNQRYRTEVQTAQNAYTAQVNLLNQKLQAETNLINQAYGAQLQVVKNFAQQSANLIQQAQQSAQQAAQRAAQIEAGKQRVQNVVSTVANTGIGGSLSNIFGGLLGFADGGRVPHDGIFQLHRDEIVLNTAQQRAVAGAMSDNRRSIVLNAPITVQGNLDNVTLGQVRNEISVGFNEFISRVGSGA